MDKDNKKIVSPFEFAIMQEADKMHNTNDAENYRAQTMEEKTVEIEEKITGFYDRIKKN